MHALGTDPTGNQPQPRPRSPSPGRDPFIEGLLNAKKKKTHVAKPDPFSGKDYKKFIRQVKLFLWANKKDFTSDDEKIEFTLSFMTEGRASKWAENFIDKAIADGTDDYPDFGAWDSFLGQLKDSFHDANEAQTAQRNLSSLRQGSTSAEEYFQNFDILRRIAGYSKDHDQYLIELLERQLSESIVTKIYGSETLPTTYDGWKRKAIRFDNLERRLKEVRRQQTPQNPPVARKPEQSTTPRTTPNTAPTYKRDSTGTVFTGTGQPMNLDEARQKGVCYKCGLPGHIGKFCPNRQKTEVRATTSDTPPSGGTGTSVSTGVEVRELKSSADIKQFVYAMTPEQKKAWAAEFNLLKESDFAGPQK